MKRVFTHITISIRPALDARRGVAAVEFALLAPALMLLFGGAVSFGDALRIKVEVGNAARAGADYVALHGNDLVNIQTAAQSATNLKLNVTVVSVPSVAECLALDGSAPTLDPSLAPCSSVTSTGAPPGQYVTVTATVLYHYIISVPGITNMATFPLSGAAMARVQ